MDVDGVDAGVPTAGTRPVLAVGMAVDPLHRLPRIAPVLAAKQAGRLGSRVDDARLVGVSGGDIPDVADDAGRGALPLAWGATGARTGVRALHVRRERQI